MNSCVVLHLPIGPGLRPARCLMLLVRRARVYHIRDVTVLELVGGDPGARV